MATVPVTIRLLGALCRSMVVRLLAVFVCERVADVAGNRTAGAVEAALLDPLPELRDIDACRVVLHRRCLRHRIRLDREHAWLRA
jgi:hypothetical protein